MSERFEATFYGDQSVEGELRDQLGPYELLNAFDYGSALPVQVLVLRAAIHAIPSEAESGPLTENDLRTEQGSFHGGDLADELAALVSLALGIRCRSGGTTRNWFISSDLDGPGQPTGFGHRRPYLPVAARREQLPHARRRVDIGEATDLLQRYLTTTPPAAIALVRAARLYEKAIWIADDDPSQAWLWLVGAVEVAAEQWRGSSGTPPEVLRENWPELSAIIEPHGDDLLDEVAAIVAGLFKAQTRFVSFVAAFRPPPPAERPYDWACVDWDRLEEHLRLIYRYRSNALHGGVPFPVPMCEGPREFDDGRPIERPDGLSTSALDAKWAAADAPMLLWVFEYITRQTLLAWWRQLPDAGSRVHGRPGPGNCA